MTEATRHTLVLGANGNVGNLLIEELAGVPIDIISTGPDREETIIKQHPFE